MINFNPIAMLITVYAILITLSIVTPCITQAILDPENQSSCLYFFKINEVASAWMGFFGGSNIFTDIISGILGIVTFLAAPLVWSIGVPNSINIFLEFLRVYAYVLIAMIIRSIV